MRNLQIAVFLLTLCIFTNTTAATWDSELTKPVPMTAEQIALADEELLPENWNKTKTAYASNYEQRLPRKNTTEQKTLVEATLSTRSGDNANDGYDTASLYAEIPFGVDGYSLWFLGYKDPAFSGSYLGLARQFSSLQIGLGGGNVHYDKLSHTVINPWMYYSSSELEAYLHAEHYSRETNNPWWYKGYIEKKHAALGLGLYGEKDMGIGPRVSYKINDHIKVWMSIPIWSLPETGKIKVLFSTILSF